MTEKEFQSDIVKAAKMLGWLCFHPYRSTRSEPGFPDLVLVRDRVIYAEVKTATGRLSMHQKAWLHALEAAGQEAYVWRPADWPDAIMAALTRKS